MIKNSHRMSLAGEKSTNFHPVRIPKARAILLWGLGLSLSAGSLQAQNAKVSLARQGARTLDILNDIERQTDYLFVYDKKNVDTNRSVSINASDQPVSSVLNQLFSGTDIVYKLEGNHIVLTRRAGNGDAAHPGQQQQKQVVTGRVTDATGEAVIGANILEKGTKNGTITDIDGTFRLSVAPGATLVISYIGYASSEVPVNGRTDLSLTLKEDSEALDEVVVVGYGMVKKKDLSGAVAAVKGSDLAARKTTQLSSALQGAVGGVMVTPSSGPGGTADIKVRGITTIGDSSPLVIVDGVPGDINQVNPNDVESMSVLKDAASAAIYGSRAAAGVILITTKRANENDLSLNYNFEYGWEKATTLPKFVNAQHYIEMCNELKYNDNNTGGWFQIYTEDQVKNWTERSKTDPDHYSDTKWDDYILKGSAPRQTHIVDLSGGGKRVKTKASFTYDKVEGLYEHKDYERYMIRVNNDFKINPFIAATLDFNFRRVKKNSPNSDPFGGRNARPDNPAVFSDGRYGTGAQLGNPYALLEQSGTYTEWYNRVGGKAAIDVTPLEGLKFSAVIAATYNFDKTKKFQTRVPYTYLSDPNTIAGYYPWGYESTKLTESRKDDYNYTVQFIGNYMKSFGQHDFNLMAGYENYYTFTENLGASRDQYEFDNFPYLDLGPLAYRDNSGSASEYAYRSWFGRLLYDYADKYLLQLNFRSDGSSRFKSKYRWGNFPSISAGWALSEESFLKDSNADWLSFLKLRVSWGKLGNERIGNYPTSGLISIFNTLFYKDGAAYSALTAAQTTYVIESLSWEKTESWNIGVDASFLNNRLRFTGDYYKKKTKDMLLSLEIPDYVGYDNPSQNTGGMHTNGWEVELGWNDHAGDWRYGVSVNLSDFISKMGDLGGTEFLGDQVKKKGSEFNEWYGYLSDGLYLTQEEVDNSAKVSGSVKVGDLKYKDLSGPDGVPDGKISPEYDRVLLGGSLPRYMYGINLNGGYKGFDLSLLLQGVGRQNVRINSNYQLLDYRWGNNFAEIMLGKYWSSTKSDEENSRAYYPRLSETNYSLNTGTLSDHWLMNGRYLRLKNVTFGYSLPKQLTEKASINQLRFYVSANNLFTIDNLPKGIDPEILGQNKYPMTKSVLFGVSINF